MADARDTIAAAVRSVFAGREVVQVGGVLAGMTPMVEELRAAGVSRMLLVPTSSGTGPLPEGDDVDVRICELPPVEGATEQFRQDEHFFTDPPETLLDLVRERVDAGAIVLGQPFSALQSVGPFPVFGRRRAEWIAREDKTTVDTMFDACGVPRPPYQVVPLDSPEVDASIVALDRGDGVVLAGDARGGFNGGSDYVRWVRDDVSRRTALEFFAGRCDRVRVAEFVEGIPCSIHGFVSATGVAAFRPVELVTLRAADEKGLRYSGCATFFDPPDEMRNAMRDAVRRVGAHLRERVGFRGTFTIDGICGRDGWMANECNPRGGAGLGFVHAAAPDLLFALAQRIAVEGRLEALDPDALEDAIVPGADATRWGGAQHLSPTTWNSTTTTAIVGDAKRGFQVDADKPADVLLHAGPGVSGGFLQVRPVPERTPSGPSIAPLAVAAFAFADAHLDAKIGPLTPAVSVG
jgi:hypothetical protein